MSNLDRMFQARSAGADGGNGRRYGVDMAKVTNIEDPDSLNRVKCQRITTDADVGETDWMYVCSPLAGAGYGMFCMPKVGDLVLLAYMGGDVHRPFVIGSLWTQEVKPPYSIKSGKNESFSFKLPSGTEVFFSETAGKEKITVTTPAGSALQIDDEGKSISLADKNGKNALTMDLSSGAVTVKADKKLTLSAGTGASIALDGAGGKVTIKGNSSVEISAAQMKANCSGTCEIKANGQMTVQSSGITQVKGSMVKIN